MRGKGGGGWKALLLLRKAGHEKGNQSNVSGGEGSNGFPLEGK